MNPKVTVAPGVSVVAQSGSVHWGREIVQLPPEPVTFWHLRATFRAVTLRVVDRTHCHFAVVTPPDCQVLSGVHVTRTALLPASESKSEQSIAFISL